MGGVTSDRPTDDDPQRWERLCEAATEGPWYADITRSGPGAAVCRSESVSTVSHPSREICKFPQKDLSAVKTMAGRAANFDFIAESRTALPRLIAAYREAMVENAFLHGLCEENDIDTGPGPLPLNPQPCGCEFDGFELIGRCAEHKSVQLPEIHYTGGLTRRFDESGFCYAEFAPMPERVQDAIDAALNRTNTTTGDHP